MVNSMTLSSDERKALDEWVTAYHDYGVGSLERMAGELDHQRDKIIALATILVEKDICTVDDICDL